MTYTAIIDELRRLHLEDVDTALNRAVEAEAKELFLISRSMRMARKEAEEFYAADISEYLDAFAALSPDDVLRYRRRPTAWAIAHKMKAAQLAPPKGGST